MKLSEIKSHLSGLKTIGFQLPEGSLVPAHFHVTEVGKISKPVDQQNNIVIYVIFKADVKPLDALKKNIKYSLLNEQKRNAIDDYIEKTKKENNIKVERVL